MAIYHEDIVNIDLENGTIHRSFMNHSIGYGDDDANRFGIRAFRNGVPETLGGTCAGYFIRADGATVVIADGVVSGNLAYVTLPEACYAVEGNFTLAIKVSGGGVTGTMRIVDGVVSRTSTSATVDPGTIIPSVEDLIDAIEDAVESIPADYSALWTTFAPAFDPDKEGGYKNGEYVTYNGHVFRFFKPHSGSWDPDDVFTATFDSEMSALTQEHRAFAGVEPITISATIASTDTRVDFTDVRLYAGVPYSIYCAEDVPTESKIYLYAAGNQSNSIGLVKGYNTITPGSDGYVRIYNEIAHYAGSLTLTIVPGAVVLKGNNLTITTAAQLSSLTHGTNSCKDFPANSIICIGTEDISIGDSPADIPYGRTGTYITFSQRGIKGNGTAQLFIGAHGQIAFRELYGGSWEVWSKALVTAKSYTTREAWLEDFPDDKIALLPQMTAYCFGSNVVAPSDAPYSGFSGTVYTLGFRSRNYYAEPGNYQIAFCLNSEIWYRRYVYDAGGNYWTAWQTAQGEAVYHVGTGQANTSLSSLLYDLRNDKTKKVIYVHEGTYDIFDEYLDLVSDGKLEVPPDDAETGDYIQYSVFVPDNTRLIGLGDVVLTMTPEAEDVTLGESYMWSPMNISGNVTLENLKVIGHNCRYALHNDDHNAVQNAHQHYKNCRFIYTWGDQKNGERLGYSNTIGFGVGEGCTHTFDDCEISYIGEGGRSAYYGHERNDGKNGTLILRNCIIRSENFSSEYTIRFQTLGTSAGHVKAYFENCYINGNLMLAMDNSASRNNFEVTFVNCNKVPVLRRRSNESVPFVDPYTVRWFNPLPTPTAQAPQYEEDSL